MARALAVLAVMAVAVFGMASAATYNVGEPGGSWDLRTDYRAWTSGKNFQPGDTLVFKYSPQAHDVVEVSKAAYDSCSTANNVNTYTSGNDAITLDRPGTRYFICGIPGHCAGGMKLEVTVGSGGSTPTPGGLAPAGAPGSSPSTPSTQPPPSSGAAKATGFGLAAAVVLAAGLMA